jgi:hypothetical protein
MQRFLEKPLEDITEEDLRQYWLACTSDFGWNAASLRVSYSGIKQFFTRTLVRSWPLLSEIRLKREETLPTVLPCHYFLLTVTVPEALRRVIRSHQRDGYAALFSCTVGALKKLARDPRFLGSQRIGCLAVLHTWGSQLQYHPHLHLVAPGGAIAPDGSEWLPARHDLFVHTKPLARIIRAKYRDAMEVAKLLDKIDPAVWSQEWVVDSQSVGGGENSLRYLARYVFRVAISNNRIVSFDQRSVTFRCKDSETRTWQTRTLDGLEFIRRFLQHVLPTGFMKVRHFGFLNGLEPSARFASLGSNPYLVRSVLLRANTFQ